MSMTRRFLVAALLALPSLALAQKKALTQADWDKWNSISGSMITSDGKWAAYTIAPLVGDGSFIIRSTSGNTEYKVPRGYLGRPNNVPGGLRPRAGGNPEDEPSGPQIAAGQFTSDGKFALVLTYPTQVEFDRVARDRRAAAAVQGRSDLAIVRLADGNVTTLSRVRSFRLPRSSGGWMAYIVADSAAATPGQQGAAPGARPVGPRRRFGSTVTLRNMVSGAEEKLADVLEYAFDDSAKVLVYSVVGRAGDKDGVYSRNLATGAVATLATGKGDYDQLVLDRTGTQVAFVSNRDEFGKDGATFSIFHGTLRTGNAVPVVTSAAVGGGSRIVESANVAFTRNGNALLFNVAPPFQDTVTADSLVGKAVFDLWHFKDPTLQPTQKLNAARDRTESQQAIYHLATKKLVKLANDSIPTVNVSDDGRVAVANSREKYMVQAMWGDGLSDVYLIDATTGLSKLVREGFDGNAQLSTGAKYLTYFEKGNWHTYNIATGKTTNVTGSVKGVSFANETDDTPGEAQTAWGIAGWTRDDRSMLIYDRWDIWEIDPAGVRAPANVTDGYGRKNTTALRLAGGGGGFGGGGGGGGGGAAAGGDDQRGIDPTKPLQLRGVNNETKAQVFASDVLGTVREPTIALTANASYGNLTKAADAEQYIVTKGTFTEFPDLYTGSSVTSLRKISDANPQQKDYRWGTVDLVRWHSADGVPLKGLLFKPEGFDSTKKYPMIVYHYESLSQNLHSYVPPNGRNVTNPTHYVSNGYLVFEPDIHYQEGYPGPSALKSIVPGVTTLMQRGFVDPKGIAIQGQSWGGYQGLYMITQTNIFSAAMLGAPVVNMTSAYGGIRWGSGINRSVQYEEGQSRIGGSIWEYPTRYIENSPLFWLDKVQTPVFFMHNDMDDAVPWYQGIEAFVGLRRLGKEVYLINYNNDVHNPASRANQKDMAMRMQQFFDHKLRGMPAPEWMTKGIPYLSKGKDQLGGTVPAPTPAIPQQ
jgi:dipeptidyl aminopeptidase/acylaminoacyl peptidase